MLRPSSFMKTRVAVDWKAMRAAVRNRASALVWLIPWLRVAEYSSSEAAM